MLTSIARPFACFVCAILFVTGSAAAKDPLSIRAVAPQKSFFVCGIDNLDASRERFEKTPLFAWWSSPEVQEASRSWRESIDRSFDSMTQELGVPRETVAWPSSFGVAAYAERNEETGMDEPVFFAFVDWAKEAEKFETLYEAAVKRLDKDRPIPFEVEEIKGRRVYVFPTEEEDADDADDDDFYYDEGSGPFDFESYCVTRDGSRLLIASGIPAMEDLIAAIEGDQARRVRDDEDFKSVMGLVGGTPDLYGALMPRQFMSIFEQAAGPEFAMARPFLGNLFGDIRGYGFGLSVDGRQAPLEQTFAVFVPGPKIGLLSMLAPGPVEKTPPMVSADAVSYNRFNIRISELMRIVDEVIASLPEMQADPVKQILEPFAPTLRTAFGAMGPGIHHWNTVQQPVTLGSQRSTTAIAVRDQKAAESLLQMFGPQIGMAPRDFLGNAIYTGDGAPFAVGFGGAFMFLGETDSVEQSLRAVGREGEAGGLEEEPFYRKAMSHVRGDNLVGYGYTDTIESMRVQSSMLHQIQAMAVEFDEDDPSQKFQLEAIDFEVDFDMKQMQKLLDPELAKNFFGPTIWTLRGIDQGFKLDYLLLPPAKD